MPVALAAGGDGLLCAQTAGAASVAISSSAAVVQPDQVLAPHARVRVLNNMSYSSIYQVTSKCVHAFILTISAGATPLLRSSGALSAYLTAECPKFGPFPSIPVMKCRQRMPLPNS